MFEVKSGEWDGGLKRAAGRGLGELQGEKLRVFRECKIDSLSGPSLWVIWGGKGLRRGVRLFWAGVEWSGKDGMRFWVMYSKRRTSEERG